MTQQPSLYARNVLLVEDEPRLREMLLRAVREMGFDAAGVSSAEQAQRLLEHQPYPVLIVDLNLPATSGMDLIRTIRRRWPAIQAIILTGFGDLNAARQAIHLDVVDFLTKPCALGDLEVALDRAFHRLLKDPPTAEAWAAMQSEQIAEFESDADSDDRQNDEELEGRGARDCAQRAGALGGSNDSAGKRDPGQPMAFEPRDTTGGMSIEDVERRAILAALEKHNGNRSATAAELGISLRKLYYRLAQYQKQGISFS